MNSATAPAGLRFPDDVRGWLTLAEGVALAQHAAGKRVLEIGCFAGRSTICLAQTARAIDVVDTFDGRATPNPGSTLAEFMTNLARYGVAAIIHVGQSAERVLALANGGRRFGLVFIDACHELDSVRTDIRVALAALGPGGLLSFHDYGREPGVDQAVGELLAMGAKLLDVTDSVALVNPAGAMAPETRGRE